jgi:hypothetical protein
MSRLGDIDRTLTGSAGAFDYAYDGFYAWRFI